MSFKSFLKEIFSLNPREDAELEKLRAKHGIKADEELSVDKGKKAEEYNVWEDLRNFRSNYFFGTWVTRKFRPVGEEKVKKELEELEKKREEERRKRGEGE